MNWIRINGLCIDLDTVETYYVVDEEKEGAVTSYITNKEGTGKIIRFYHKGSDHWNRFDWIKFDTTEECGVMRNWLDKTFGVREVSISTGSIELKVNGKLVEN